LDREERLVMLLELLLEQAEQQVVLDHYLREAA
jgi:hypothetical protein